MILASLTVARAEQILLVPLDSRPAAGQFAQMMARIAGVDVRMPPYETLGRFTTPGDPDRILDWIENQDLTKYASIVASADMLAYGGLIASRVNTTSEVIAQRRIARLANLRNRYPNLRLYVYSATMRIAPTATRAAAPWRMHLARYLEANDEFQRTKAPRAQQIAESHKRRVPPEQLSAYLRTRERNWRLQRTLVELTKAGRFDYLTIGQDDAHEYGPHRNEVARLRSLVASLNIQGRTYFCEGIDQHASVLVSRAILRRGEVVPRVRLVYSDPALASQIAQFESKPLRQVMEDQLYASGARPVGPDGAYDYTLFVNVPGSREAERSAFQAALAEELDANRPVAFADTDISRIDGTTDPRWFETLEKNRRGMRLMSYAGWNTAGNTLGTAIPAANLVHYARQKDVAFEEREVARCEFLVHRMVNDYLYHRVTRPRAKELINVLDDATLEETRGDSLSALNRFVQQDLERELDRFFRAMVDGETLRSASATYVLDSIEDIRIWLPWPRIYEVRIEFRLVAHKQE